METYTLPASKMTAEYLGSDATDEDLRLFQRFVRDLMSRDGYNEQDATDIMWGFGDFLAMAQRLGLD